MKIRIIFADSSADYDAFVEGFIRSGGQFDEYIFGGVSVEANDMTPAEFFEWLEDENFELTDFKEITLAF